MRARRSMLYAGTMRRIIVGVALLLACGGRALPTDDEPGGFSPDMQPPSSLNPVRPSPGVPPSGVGGTQPPSMGVMPMMPQTPMTPREPNTPPPMQPEPPVAMPEPPFVEPEPDPNPDPTLCADAAFFTITALEQSTIDALEGCEEMFSLEVLAPLDLRPLASLRRLVGLYLRNVASLEGLENVEQAEVVLLSGAELRSVRPLSGLRYLDELQVGDTSLVDLTGLENVRGLVNLRVQNNIDLESLNGLVLQDPANYVTITDNPALRDVTSLGPLREVWTLEIARNPQLTEVPVFFQLVFVESFQLTDNAALRAAPEFPSITWISTLNISFNTALERFAFPALQIADTLTVTGNPSLVEVGLPLLSEAGYVNIYYNQQLDGVALGESLAGVTASELRVAPDQTQSVLDPCPWTTDTLCDEFGQCAPGTDPVCRSF